MKAKELMIGDLVKRKKFGSIHKVSIIDLTIASEFNPIPLTPEILEKNGFVESEIEREEFSDIGLRYIYETQDGSYLIVDYQDSFDNGCGGELHQRQKELWIITVFGCNGLFESNPRERVYVHELQRALRCCGLNELADGFKV